jgi:hypothetical protein
VIARNMQRHRHQEFIRFLNAVECWAHVSVSESKFSPQAKQQIDLTHNCQKLRFSPGDTCCAAAGGTVFQPLSNHKIADLKTPCVTSTWALFEHEILAQTIQSLSFLRTAERKLQVTDEDVSRCVARIKPYGTAEHSQCLSV